MSRRTRLHRYPFALASRYLRPTVRLGAAAAWTTGVVSTKIAHGGVRPREDGRLEQVYSQLWSRGLLRTLGARILLHNSLPPVGPRPRLVVANHRTVYDILVVLSLFRCFLLSRADLQGWPLMGWAARHGGTLFVDRNNRDSRGAAVQALRAALQRGLSVAVFPEGTTYEGDELHPFRPGSFRATVGLDVDIIPVGLAYPPNLGFTEDSFLDHCMDLTRRPSLPIGVAVGNAMRPYGEDAGAIAHSVQDEVQRLVHCARQRLNQGLSPRR